MNTPVHELAARRRLWRLQLPQRLARVQRRGARLLREGWDLNTLKRLADDCALLAGACRELGAADLADQLTALHTDSAALLDPPQRPDRAATTQIAARLAQLAQLPLPDAQAAASGGGLGARLRHALDTHGFELAFQPIVPLHSDAEHPFQVLLRLRGDGGRLHVAAELIPAAAAAGLLGAVDRWVLEHCLALIVRRRREGHAPQLFVSQSLDSVQDPDAPARLQALLTRYAVAGAQLTLELRLDEAVAAPEATRRYADAVTALGVQLALSAFAPGPAADSLLDALPLDCVKLAPRYAMQRDELRALVARLHQRGLRVIAPQVEDARAAAALHGAGVDFIQGDFVQAPGAELVFEFREEMV